MRAARPLEAGFIAELTGPSRLFPHGGIHSILRGISSCVLRKHQPTEGDKVFAKLGCSTSRFSAAVAANQWARRWSLRVANFRDATMLASVFLKDPFTFDVPLFAVDHEETVP